MKPAAMGRFSAVCNSAGVSPVGPRARSGAPVGVGRRFLLELQWRGSGGRFRHLAVRRSGLRKMAVALGAVACVALAVVLASAFSPTSNRPLAHFGVGAILSEHAGLKNRHNALRERAFDLAEQLYARVEQGRRKLRRTGTAAGSWMGQCPRPPARDAEDEAIFIWLAEQGTRLEAIGDALTAGRVETGVMQAYTLAPARTRGAAADRAGAIEVADVGSGGGFGAASATR